MSDEIHTQWQLKRENGKKVEKDLDSLTGGQKKMEKELSSIKVQLANVKEEMAGVKDQVAEVKALLKEAIAARL